MTPKLLYRQDNGAAPESLQRDAVRLAFFFRRQLDAAGFAALFSPIDGFVTVGTGTQLTEAEQLCRACRPHVAIIDANYSAQLACQTASQLLSRDLLNSVVLLDDDIRLARVNCALSISRCGYFTRDSTVEEICHGIRELLCGNLAVDRRLAPDGDRSHKALKNAIRRLDDHGFLGLSAREQQVMQLLAQGKTAPQIGEALGLHVSTVDNHRTRVMKKLNVHKAPKLTQIAIRVGLID